MRVVKEKKKGSTRERRRGKKGGGGRDSQGERERESVRGIDLQVVDVNSGSEEVITQL